MCDASPGGEVAPKTFRRSAQRYHATMTVSNVNMKALGLQNNLPPFDDISKAAGVIGTRLPANSNPGRAGESIITSGCSGLSESRITRAMIIGLGCARGDLLAALEPSSRIGIYFSEEMISGARRRHPHLLFVRADAHALNIILSSFSPTW